MNINQQINRAMDNIEKKAEKILSKKVGFAVGKMYDQIIDFTPIDTGNLHRNWEINWGNGFDNTSGDYASKLKSAADQGQYRLQDIEIRNQTEYAYYVEYGKISGNKYSQQAPQGMMRISAKMLRNWL